jgi:hypothetical protein
VLCDSKQAGEMQLCVVRRCFSCREISEQNNFCVTGDLSQHLLIFAYYFAE